MGGWCVCVCVRRSWFFLMYRLSLNKRRLLTPVGPSAALKPPCEIHARGCGGAAARSHDGKTAALVALAAGGRRREEAGWAAAALPR